MRGFEDWSMEDVIRHNEKIKPSKKQLDYLQAISSENKKSKYRAIKCEIDGHTFDSKAEAKRYSELKLMQQAGKISELQLQPRYILQDSFKKNGQAFRKIEYIADFSYMENGNLIIEDVKRYEDKRI